MILQIVSRPCISVYCYDAYPSGNPIVIKSGYACSSPVVMATLFKPWRCSPVVSQEPPLSSGAIYCAASHSGSRRLSIAYKRMDPIPLVCEQLHDGTYKAHQTLRPCAAVQAVVTAASETFTYESGQALPLGASQAENGINFALFSQNATSVSLCM